MTPPAPEERTVERCSRKRRAKQLWRKRATPTSLLIGDSVSVAIGDWADTDTSARRSRAQRSTPPSGASSYTAKDVYQQHVDNGWNGPVVIFEVGTNGVATADDVREMVESVPSDKYVYLINVRSPDPLQDINNPLLQQAADEHDNVRIIDWHTASAATTSTSTETAPISPASTGARRTWRS